MQGMYHSNIHSLFFFIYYVLPKWPGFTAGSLNERFAESKNLKKNELAKKKY